VPSLRVFGRLRRLRIRAPGGSGVRGTPRGRLLSDGPIDPLNETPSDFLRLFEARRRSRDHTAAAAHPLHSRLIWEVPAMAAGRVRRPFRPAFWRGAACDEPSAYCRLFAAGPGEALEERRYSSCDNPISESPTQPLPLRLLQSSFDTHLLPHGLVGLHDSGGFLCRRESQTERRSFPDFTVKLNCSVVQLEDQKG